MKNAVLRNADNLNEFELLQVADYMEKHRPGVQYTMTPGNNCIRVYYGMINEYFIFCDGRIVDVQID